MIGLFNKVVIADTLMALVVEAGYYTTGNVGLLMHGWVPLHLRFKYFVILGYSTCAIGVALCLDRIALTSGFYAAVGFSNF